MDENAAGGKNYNRIIQSVRANNQLVGPQHHEHNKHFKEWCKGKSAEEINTHITKRAKILSKSEASDINKKIISAKVKSVEITKCKKIISEEERLREKYEQMKRQKIIDGLKSDCKCRHIKSVGNGL